MATGAKPAYNAGADDDSRTKREDERIDECTTRALEQTPAVLGRQSSGCGTVAVATVPVNDVRELSEAVPGDGDE